MSGLTIYSTLSQIINREKHKEMQYRKIMQYVKFWNGTDVHLLRCF